MGFEEAVEFCKNMEMSVASIIDGDEAFRANNQALQKSNSTLIWLGGNYTGSQLVWNDGHNSTFQHFEIAPPDAGQVVMRRQTGKWTTVRGGKFPVACMGGNTPTHCTSTVFVGHEVPPCDPEWLESAHLKVSPGRRLERNVSISAYSELTTQYLRDPAVNAFSDQAGAWIGGIRVGSEKPIFKWVDGTVWDYENWAHGQPNDSPGPQNFLQIYTARFNYSQTATNHHSLYLNRWNDIHDVVGFSAICKMESKYADNLS
ncbi:unnamed protein product, partial [Mesorhabditis spiculigera]